ncbi:MAG: hypothetical protein JW885_03160 [Deltaproteobacteria bacterium]|nr:hypothetical protein [Candidatus Zymogenaceae bacterium]
MKKNKICIISAIILALVVPMSVLAQETLPDLPDSAVSIPWSDFKELIKELVAPPPVPPGPPAPPMNFTLSEAEYTGRVVGDNAVFDVTLALNVLAEDEWVEVPLFPSDTAIGDVTMDGRPVTLTVADWYYTLITDEPGSHILSLTLYAPIYEGYGNDSVEISVPEVATSKVRFSVGEPDLEFEVSPASYLTTSPTGTSTTVDAVLPAGTWVSISWRSEFEEGTSGELRVQAQVDTLISVGEGFLVGVSTINYEILHDSLTSFSFLVPTDIDIIDVQGEGVREWNTEKEGDRVKVTVAAGYEVTGDFSLAVLYEKNMEDTTAEVSVPQIEVLDVVREKGYLAVTAATRVGVEEVRLENLAMLDVTELPGGLVSASDTPIFYSYKYITHPYSLILAVSTFEDIEVIDANVSRAELKSLLTRRGDFVTRAVFEVANNARQFMKLELPENTTIWSTYVSGRPVKPAMDEDGTILIPLDRSERTGYGNGGLSSFDVEVIYFTETKDLSSVFGRRGFTAPLVNMKVDELIWTLYLPEKYVYKDTGDDMDYYGGPGPTPIREDKEFGMVGGAMRSVEEAPSIYADEMMDYSGVEGEWDADMPAEMPESQVYMEKNIYTEGLESLGGETGRGMKGVLPVRFDIPFTGHSMSYRKVIVNPDDVSSVKIRYQSRDLIHWVEMLEVIAWAVVFGVIIVGIRSMVRKRKLYLNKDKTIALASAVGVIVLLHIVFILRGGLPGWGVFWGLVGGSVFLARDAVVAAKRSIALHREKRDQQNKEAVAAKSKKTKKADETGE